MWQGCQMRIYLIRFTISQLRQSTALLCQEGIGPVGATIGYSGVLRNPQAQANKSLTLPHTTSTPHKHRRMWHTRSVSGASRGIVVCLSPW